MKATTSTNGLVTNGLVSTGAERARSTGPAASALWCGVVAFVGLAAAALVPSRVQAQSFYVMVVEWEGVSESSASGLEVELPAMARRCAGAGSSRGIAVGQRVALVDLQTDGTVSDVEVRSDDVSPSAAETSFGRCLERALRARRYEAPASTPAIIEIAFEYARTVPEAHRPGGSGVRRGPRAHQQRHHAQGTGLPPERVREVAGQHAAEIEQCVHSSVTGSETLAGRLELEMTILPDGHVEMVSTVSSTTHNARFDECVSANARTWLFPAPGARVAIRYPLVIASEVSPR
ncbi:MAG: AgmX/PglI C-terminal domain-containing protein [Sandaracinus sp.]